MIPRFPTPMACAALAVLALAGCGVLSHRGGTSDTGDALIYRDLEGVEHRPLVVRDAVASVLIFTTTDCPVANSYAPEIRSIFEEFEPRGVEFFLVHVDPDTTAARAREHAGEYDLPCRILRDPQHRLVDRTGVKITPEAAVFDAEGAMVYRGRIDGRYSELGKRRRTFEDHDLREALEAVLAGEAVFPSRTEAIGCFIADFRLDV